MDLAGEKRDYYQVLELERSCTVIEIKKSYRKLAHKYHPDVNNGNPEAEERFKEISEAYAVLSNSDKRSQYDQFGFNRNLFEDFDVNSVFSEFGFGDIFNAFFGGGSGTSRRRARSKGSDIGVAVKISFKEAAFGVKKEVEYSVEGICGQCGGKGSAAEDGVETCGTCGGAGKVNVSRQTLIGNIITTSTCSDCRGSGKIIKEPCKKCRGRGFHSTKRKVKVDIPGGIHDGDQLRVTGKGNSLGEDSISGDLFITAKVLPHPEFRRVDDNVLYNLEISIAQAALGLKLEIETLDGKEKITIKPGTQPNTKIVLRSRGVVHLNGFRRGDHIINIDVKVPTKLSREEKALLLKLAGLRDETTGGAAGSIFSRLKNTPDK